MPDATDTNAEPETFADLPIQPTGSGVADLAIAYEQMRLADDDAGAVDAGVVDETPSDDAAMTPTEDTTDAADSSAHPS